MNLPPFQVALIAVVATAAISALVYFDRMVPAGLRALYRIAMAVLVAAAFFFGVQRLIPDFGVSVDVSKGAIAAVAAGCVFYEIHREGQKRPIAEKWKHFVAAALACAAFISYFDGFRNGYEKLYHRHELYHYYLGAKYFPELGYDGLYKCTVIAQDQLGVYSYVNEDTGRTLYIDMAKEARHPDRKVRNLGQDNLLKPASYFLDNPKQCTEIFTPERWEAFKKDIAFFRTASDREYFNHMQTDHGFNPPPVWAIAGKFFADLHPASTGYMQFLASLDMMFWLGMFGALWWAFGWRVSAVAVIFWGTQSSAPMLWTCGAFLRQDWLFFLVLCVCLVRKKHPALAAAALVYSALLRIFPGLLVIGWLAVVFWQLVKHKRLTKEQLQMLGGGVVAAAVLLGGSLSIVGWDVHKGVDAYKQFKVHTLEVHDRTPLTNHMGLRVLLAQKLPFQIEPLGIGVGPQSGRMKYTEDNKLSDAFEVWKRMRNERWDRLKPIAYAINALTLAFFLYITRRMKNMWVALCSAQIFVMTLSQLTCYYYSFMILSAPLTRLKGFRRNLEVSLFGFSIVSLFGWRIFGHNDDKYWVLSLLSILFGYGLLFALVPSSVWVKLREKLPFLKGRTDAPQSSAA
jgi:hypothetical protein